MTTATMSAPGSRAAAGIDWLFLGLALAATALLVALVLLDGQPASAALVLSGFGLGVAFLKAEHRCRLGALDRIAEGDAPGMAAGQ